MLQENRLGDLGVFFLGGFFVFESFCDLRDTVFLIVPVDLYTPYVNSRSNPPPPLHTSIPILVEGFLMVSGMLAAMVRVQHPSSHGYDAELLCHGVEKWCG
jgi:hypothetical protein